MENSFRFFANMACRYYPCHEGLSEINCLFCYCPLYEREDCPGTPEYVKKKDGSVIRSCVHCVFPHRAENYPAMMKLLSEASCRTGKRAVPERGRQDRMQDQASPAERTEGETEKSGS